MSDAHREEIKKLESLYAEHPEGRIFTHLAEAYRKAGELEQARAVLEDGIRKHPDYSSAHVVLGRVLMDQDRGAEAEAEFHRVIELDAHNMVALRALGDLARLDGRSEDALDYYHRLLEVEPADEDVRALVEQVIAGDVGAPGTGPDETAEEGAEPVEGTWAPHGLVEGSSFEEAAWSLSGQSESDDDFVASDPYAGSGQEPDDVTGAPEDAADTADTAADEPVADPMDGEWVPFGSAPAGDVDDAELGDEDEAGEVDDLPWLTGADPSDLPEGGAYARPEEPDQDTGADDVDAPWGQAPWEEAAIDDIEELGPFDDEPEDAPPPTSSPGVMTETIAQVYARQGLYDRAAEVYRELVRERPGDDGLRERLAEMEELAAHVASTRGDTALTSAPARGDEADEADEADEGEGGFQQGLETFDGPEAQGEEVPVAGLETSEADLAAEPVPLEGLEVQDVDPETHLVEAGDGSGEGVEVPPELDVRDVPQPPEEEPWAERHADADPWAATPAAESAESAESADGSEEAEPVDVEPVGAADGEGEPDATEPAVTEPAVDPEEGSVWTGAEWGEAEATTPYAWAESEEEAESDDTAPVEQYFRGLLAWDGQRAASEPAAEGDDATADAEREAGSEGGADATADAPSDAGGGGEGGDDDDLDVFRSWLESLKQ